MVRVTCRRCGRPFFAGDASTLLSSASEAKVRYKAPVRMEWRAMVRYICMCGRIDVCGRSDVVGAEAVGGKGEIKFRCGRDDY